MNINSSRDWGRNTEYKKEVLDLFYLFDKFVIPALHVRLCVFKKTCFNEGFYNIIHQGILAFVIRIGKEF